MLSLNHSRGRGAEERGKHECPELFWKRGGQDRARGRHLTAANTLSAFRRFNQWEGGGLSTFGRFNQWGGGGGGANVSFRPIQSMSCPHSQQIQPVVNQWTVLSANSASGGAHVCKQGGGGRRHSVPRGGAMAPPPPPGDADGKRRGRGKTPLGDPSTHSHQINSHPFRS